MPWQPRIGGDPKKLTLSLYQWLVARDAVHLIEIECFSDRHFWHGGYDKAALVTRAVGWIRTWPVAG
jgi:hypothetical protein